MGQWDDESVQVVLFRLGENYLSCPISQVEEIIQIEGVTPVPSTPDIIKGIINRRGEIITVVDLAKLMGLDIEIDLKDSQLMILYSEENDVGIVVSEVTEIPTINTEDIEEPSKPLETPINKKYLDGIVKKDDRLILLIDLLSLIENLALEELQEVEKITTDKQ